MIFQLPSFHHSDQRNSFTLYTIVIESIPHLIVVLLKCSVRGQMGSFSDFIMLLRITSAANYVLLGWVLRFPQGLFPLVLVRICFCHIAESKMFQCPYDIWSQWKTNSEKQTDFLCLKHDLL